MVTTSTTKPRQTAQAPEHAKDSGNAGKTHGQSNSPLVVLTGTDVDQLLSTLDPMEEIESQSRVFQAFSGSSEVSSGAESESDPSTSVQAPPRLSLTSSQCTTLFMPSHVPPIGAGIKIVSVPTASDGGLPASTMLLDSTGRVKALINARKLTALRNAAGSALFVQTFPCPRPPTNLLIFGTGAQAYAHAIIFLKVFKSLKSLTIIARRPSSRADELVQTLRSEYPNINITLGISDPSSDQDQAGPAGNPFNLSQVVHNANIILTLTPSTTPLFNTVDVTSHTRLVLVGSYKPSMREVSDDLIQRAGRVVVDTAEGCLKEAGEIISSGIAQRGGIVELGKCLGEGDAAKAERKTVEEAGDIVLYKSVGIGIQDIAIADLVLRQAQAKGVGIVVPNYD